MINNLSDEQKQHINFNILVFGVTASVFYVLVSLIFKGSPLTSIYFNILVFGTMMLYGLSALVLGVLVYTIRYQRTPFVVEGFSARFFGFVIFVAGILLFLSNI